LLKRFYIYGFARHANFFYHDTAGYCLADLCMACMTSPTRPFLGLLHIFSNSSISMQLTSWLMKRNNIKITITNKWTKHVLKQM